MIDDVSEAGAKVEASEAVGVIAIEGHKDETKDLFQALISLLRPGVFTGECLVVGLVGL